MATTLVTRQSLKFSLDVPVLCNKSAGLQLSNSMCQLGCTLQILHGTQLTLSCLDMPGQMQSPGHKNASRYQSSNLQKTIVQSSLDAAKKLVVPGRMVSTNVTTRPWGQICHLEAQLTLESSHNNMCGLACRMQYAMPA